MRVSIITSHDPIREHSLSSVMKADLRMTQDISSTIGSRPISFLLHASMIILWSDQHIHTGYGMEARFASHMPSNCTVGTTKRFSIDPCFERKNAKAFECNEVFELSIYVVFTAVLKAKATLSFCMQNLI
ncbi:hypothetical protein TNCV_2503901 [Trichonephila clavipes]|nr:hypothetical protein TNCV_2503901 [Trichonephila clavipes]